VLPCEVSRFPLQAAEEFHERGCLERSKRERLTFCREHAIGTRSMGVRVGVPPQEALAIRQGSLPAL